MQQQRPRITHLDRQMIVELLEPRWMLSSSLDVAWSLYLGGPGRDSDTVAVDSSGCIIVAGGTSSTDLAGMRNTYHGGDFDVAVSKLDSRGNALWGIYLGGTGSDSVSRIVVDSAGNTYITGTTRSTDFAGANNAYHGGTSDVFIAKVSASGQLLWATYLGGGDDGGIYWSDTATDIAVDRAGSAFVVGDTWSLDFAGAGTPLRPGGSFAAKVSASGDLLWATYLGGGGQGLAGGVAVDDAGSAFVTGVTSSASFPRAINGNHIHNSALGLVGDAFVAKLSSSGELLWAAYLGGTGSDVAGGVAIDNSGRLVIAGRTNSTDFDRATNQFHGGECDGFVAKMSDSGDLIWATYVGGSGYDALLNLMPFPIHRTVVSAG